MNPQLSDIILLHNIKRERQFQNLQYNQQQLEQKYERKKHQKLKQIQQSYLLNRQAIEDQQYERYNQYERKYNIRQTLQQSYNQQLNKHQRLKSQEKQIDKVYSQLHKKMLENQQKRRIKDMAKIYNIKDEKKIRNKTYADIVLKTQGNQDNYYQNYRAGNSRYQPRYIDKKNGSDQKGQPTRIDEDILSTVELKKDSIKLLAQMKNINPSTNNFNEIIRPNLITSTNGHKRETPTFSPTLQSPSQNIPKTPIIPSSIRNKYSKTNLQYSEYLRKQIDRKSKQKQYKKQKQQQNDKNRLENQLRNDYKLMQEKMFQKQQQKIELSSILDKQIRLRQQKQKTIFGTSGRRYFKY